MEFMFEYLPIPLTSRHIHTILYIEVPNQDDPMLFRLLSFCVST